MKDSLDNKLIAKFLGWMEEEGAWYKKTDCSIVMAYSPPYPHNDLPFHRSWEWLMCVVDVIEKLHFRIIIGEIYERDFITKIYYCGNDKIDFLEYFDNRDKLDQNIMVIYQNGRNTVLFYDEDKLLSTHKAIVEFIKWHNQHKTI